MKCVVCGQPTRIGKDKQIRKTCSDKCLRELRNKNGKINRVKYPYINPHASKRERHVPWEDENAEKEYIERIIE
jgi:predicted nucleic acid-binding Zn ribbon protein